ncbi:MAG: hypothetical protein EOO99_00395 [Pedobacter sp.]|nr:MAG: hypothetical protein EOO99_00395 [Pedobacter sp.]
MKLFYWNLLLLFMGQVAYAQGDVATKKKTTAVRSTQPIKIDGNLNDSEWAKAPILTSFAQVRPNPGKIEEEHYRTEVKILYDNEAIYIGAKMYDKPSEIVRELRARDQIGNADFFGVFFDTFLDGINANGFFVTAAGVQFDAKYSVDAGEDPNWNAVWESEVQMVEDGWTAEMKIPYSALRFSNKDSQNWGFNLIRNRTGKNEQSFWNFVDPKVNGIVNQFGVLENLEAIKAPLRLAFSPYLSTNVGYFPNPGGPNWTNAFNGGMDVKYGIDKSFTLDMTLIPDFGQVQSDNRILNLTPFEVRFNENRQFFTEGTELFNKGDLFYSKRIGSIPSFSHNINLAPGEKFVQYPQEAKVLNATKISGRTASGLGVGVFNAVTNRMYAQVEDAQGNRRDVENQPLTNYNVFVLDQNLKNNSSVSFVNTNVWRNGSAYDANVSAVLMNLNTKGNKYGMSGGAKMSYLTEATNTADRFGYSYNFSAGKRSGNFLYSYSMNMADRKFDPSDMGFYRNNNFLAQGINLSYNNFKPTKLYNNFQSWVAVEYSRRVKPTAFQSLAFFPGVYMQFKNFWSMELIGNFYGEQHDFYEARNGEMFKTPARQTYALYINPNRAKAYNFGGNIRYTSYDYKEGRTNNYYFFQNLRLNDKFALGLDLYYSPNRNLVNWVTMSGNKSIFSLYDRETVENSFDVKYSFNRKMGITMILRHYWSDRRNKEFMELQSDGYLKAVPTQEAWKKLNRNYNVFNIDMVYLWQFRPGSELSISYKNAGELNEADIRKGYGRNFNQILSHDQQQNLSIKVLYYLDYLQLKKKK